MVTYLGNGITFPTAFSGDIKASGIAFPVIGLLLLILRVLLNVSKKIRTGLAEAFALCSWLVLVGMGAVFVWSAENGGLGSPTPTDQPALTETTISAFEKNVAISEYIFLVLMIVALGTTKLSLLFFFRKIFASGHRNIWIQFSSGLIVIVSLWTIAFTLGFILVCGRHPDAFWGPENVRKQCLQITGGYSMLEKASLISDLILDVACILIPLPVVLGLHMQLRYKVAIAAVFMVGIMTVIAGVARLVVWIQILNTADHLTEDFNLALTLALQWGMIETGLAFIVSQLSPLGAFLNKNTRLDVAETIRYAVSVISLRSQEYSGSSNGKTMTTRQRSVTPEQHEQDDIRSKASY